MKFKSCLLKQDELKKLFLAFSTPEKKYEKVIELGRSLPSYPSSYMTDEHLVKGCQSRLYLHSQIKGGNIYYHAYSDALISAGLAALLLKVYNGESPEAVIKCPPHILKELGLLHLLTPSRSNGLKSLYMKMQQQAFNFFK